jgi:oligopeptide transport system permease protein
VENLNRRYNLDRPGWEQFTRFLAGAVRGDLGVSYFNQDRAVATIILDGLPVTATIGVVGAVIALAIGLTLGTAAAVRPRSAIEGVALFVGTLGVAIPSIVSSILLVIVFALALNWFPTGGWQSPAAAWHALVAGRWGEVGPQLWASLSRVVLPALALALAPAALLTRVTRASVLEVIHQDYVRTAHAKGLRERLVVTRHVLKNALIPIMTVAGPLAADLVTGSFIVESIFGIPGIGRNFVQAVGARDYPLIMGSVLVYAVVIAFANLIVDVLYAVADPRVRYG